VTPTVQDVHGTTLHEKTHIASMKQPLASLADKSTELISSAELIIKSVDYTITAALLNRLAPLLGATDAPEFAAAAGAAR